ncbi:MAG: hypothetical protein QM675_03435 [Protaetiibacter sp.]
MSDDTPTRRYPDGFPPPGGATPPEPVASESSPLAEAPTELFAAPTDRPAPATIPFADPAPIANTVPPTNTVPPAGTAPPAGTVPPGAATTSGGSSNRGLVIALAVIAGVLLLALIGVLLWIAFANGGSTPTAVESASPSPSTTPSPTPTESESPSPSPSPTPTETTPPPPADVITSYTASTASVDCTGQGGGSVPVTFSWATTGETLWFGVGTDDARAEPYDEFPLNYTMEFDYQCGQEDQQQRYTITVLRSDGSTQSETIVIGET